jgi:O-antigen ligase
MTTRDRTFWMLGLLVAGALAGTQALVAYRTDPLIAAGAPLGIAVVAVIAWRPMFGVYLGILTIPVSNFSVTVANTHFSIAEGIFMVTAAMAVGRLIATGRGISRPHPAHVAFLAFIGWAALGLLFAEDPFTVQKILIFWVIFAIISMLIASASPKQIELVLLCIALTGGIVGVVAVTTGGPQELESAGQIAQGRAQSSFAHPNVFAFYLILSLAPAIALAGRGPQWRRLLMLGCTGAIIAGLALTLARGGIIGGAVSLLVLLGWAPFRRVAFGLLVLLSLFAAFNFNSLQNAQEVKIVSQRLGTLSNRESVRENPRVRIWSKTFPMIANHPWTGVGEGNYPIWSPRYGLLDIGGLHYDHAHDLLLTITAETGLIGLALFVAFLWGVGRTAARALRARRPETYALALAMTAALTGLLVTSFAEYPPRTTVIMATIMIEVGGLIACARWASERDAQDAQVAEPPAPPRGRHARLLGSGPLRERSS